MKECEAREAALSAWIDGEVSGGELFELVDHLVRCEPCRAFYREARSLDGLLAIVRTPQGAPLPSPEVWRRIERETAPRHLWIRPGSGFLRAAALLAVSAGVAFGLWSARSSPEALPQTIDVRIGQDRGRMTEARFFELATELLRSDRRYQLAALDVMRQVTDDTQAKESSEGETRETAREEGGEAQARRLPA